MDAYKTLEGARILVLEKLSSIYGVNIPFADIQICMDDEQGLGLGINKDHPYQLEILRVLGYPEVVNLMEKASIEYHLF